MLFLRDNGRVTGHVRKEMGEAKNQIRLHNKVAQSVPPKFNEQVRLCLSITRTRSWAYLYHRYRVTKQKGYCLETDWT